MNRAEQARLHDDAGVRDADLQQLVNIPDQLPGSVPLLVSRLDEVLTLVLLRQFDFFGSFRRGDSTIATSSQVKQAST